MSGFGGAWRGSVDAWCYLFIRLLIVKSHENASGSLFDEDGGVLWCGLCLAARPPNLILLAGCGVICLIACVREYRQGGGRGPKVYRDEGKMAEGLGGTVVW